MKRFFPILAVLSFLLYPINTIAGGPDQGNGIAIDPQPGEVYPKIPRGLAVTPDRVNAVGTPDQGNGVAIDPQTGEVYPITSGRLAVTPEWVYPFLGFTILKPPSIDPPRSPPYKPKKQRSKYKFSQAHTQTIEGDNSASVSSGGKSSTSGNGELGIVIYGSDGTQRIVQPSQAKKTFEDGIVVYGLDN